jgi:histidyl-tRNA synthetase
MYRYSAPQRGRYREHWQLSVEAIGTDDPAIDAELIALYADILGRLGITKYELQLNSIGDRECRPAYLEQLEGWLDEHEADLDDDARHKRASSPLRVFDTKSDTVAGLLAAAPQIGDSLCDACRAHFEEVRGYLDAFGVSYRLVPTLVRGLDYYTRTTFEFVDEKIGAQSSICGGGRYDYLAEELGAKHTPGIGFGAGIERLLLSLGDAPLEEDAGIDVFFVIEDGADRAATLGAMMELRRAGLSCDADYAGRSRKGQLTQASRLGAREVVVADTDTDLVAVVERLRP